MKNTSALVLDEMIPPRFTPCGKYYVTKTIWLCEDIFKILIKILKIDTLQHLGDLFTKVLYKATSKYL